jgi:hypothetical protein
MLGFSKYIFIITILIYRTTSWLRFMPLSALHYRNYFFVASVFAQMESQQYFSPDDNSNSTNVVKVEINVVRFSINGSAPSIFMYF